MDNEMIAKRLVKIAGKVLSPGIPDGSGPWFGGEPGSGLRRGPCEFDDELEEEFDDGLDDDNERIAKELLKLAKLLV